MKTRRKGREIAFQFLYKVGLENDATALPEEEELESQLQRHFEHFDVAKEIRSFVGELVRGVSERRIEIDEKISAHSTSWSIDRMPLVDRTLLRMAAFEIMFLDDIPTQVAINEAIELGRQFGSEGSPKFINGVLDALAKG